jgi:FAD/FMN-containing dehydrogenase
MKGLQTHDYFSPKGCNITINSTAVTAAGGAQMMEMYSALDKLNQTVVGGGSKSVAVGGYFTGGGHSLLSARHGLAADQVLEMELVTPTGEIVTANECQNKDLFWAMRGVSQDIQAPAGMFLCLLTRY